MFILPAVFFSLFFFSSYQRKGLDLGGFLILVYIFSSIASIYLHILAPYEFGVDYSFNISFVPTFVYVIMICIGILPFYIINTNIKKPFKLISNIKYFNFIGYCYIALFFFLSVFLWNDIINGIFQQSFADMRQEMHDGTLENAFSRQSSFIGKLIGYGAACVGSGAYFMIPFFFYSICFTNNKTYFNLLLLLSSLSSVIMGIIVIDRSTTVLWVMHLIISYFLFRPYLTSKSKTLLKKAVFIIGGFLSVYFVAVTISRFVMADGGTSGGVIRYVGQSYLNFCNVWDNVDVYQYRINHIFPLTNDLFIHTDTETPNYITRNMEDNVLNAFYTYLGFLYIDLDYLGAIVIPLLISLFSLSICDRIKHKKILCIRDLLYIYMLAIVPMFGIIAYFYRSYNTTLNLIFILIIISKFRYKRVQTIY